jgi:hypothetical protein
MKITINQIAQIERGLVARQARDEERASVNQIAQIERGLVARQARDEERASVNQIAQEAAKYV